MAVVKPIVTSAIKLPIAVRTGDPIQGLEAGPTIIDRLVMAPAFALAGAFLPLFGFMPDEQIGITQTPPTAASDRLTGGIFAAGARFAAATGRSIGRIAAPYGEGIPALA